MHRRDTNIRRTAPGSMFDGNKLLTRKETEQSMDSKHSCGLNRAHLLNPFTRRRLLSSMGALAAGSILPGCGSSVSRAASTPANPQPVPSGALTASSLSVTASSAGVIGSGFAGLSFDKGNLLSAPNFFSPSNSTLIELFQMLGPSVLRIGGSTVEQMTWTPNGPGATLGQIAPSDVNKLAGFVKATGWQCIYGVNLGGAGPDPYTSGSIVATTTPALAAAEVAYAAEVFGSALLGIEIGNEPNGYGSSYFASTTWNISTFEALWSEFRSAILAQTPGVTITGPGCSFDADNWTIPFGEWATKSNLSILTQHFYRGDGQDASSTAAELISPDANLMKGLANLQSASQSIGIPYRFSECNGYTEQGSSAAMNSFAASLWVIDFLFETALNGCSGVNLQEGGGVGNAWNPIVESQGIISGVSPDCYGILLFNLAGQGTLYPATLSGIGSLNITAYAVKTASGGLNIVVVNKDSAQNLQLSIQLPQTISSATLLEMTQLSPGASGPSLTGSSGVTIQGASVILNSVFAPGSPYTLTANGSELSCYVPYLSAVLIQTT